VRAGLAAAAVAGLAVFVPAGAASTSVPRLVSAAVQRGHVVVVFDLGGAPDLDADRIVVAVAPTTEPDGGFALANVRLQETIGNATTTVPGGERAQTRHTLPAGRYYVKVSALPVGVDCLPAKPCRVDWSNARLVLVPRR
jgi:hypothetical protein